MEINADFSKSLLIRADDLPWIASPVAGVERRMLDRLGDEVARATSIVRYAPESHFSPHVHEGGEEFIVLDGVFQDEHGDYPAGTYIRNPPTTRHRPGSTTGCTIFVKLWQFARDDRTEVKIDMNRVETIADPARPGVTVTPLFIDDRETVRLEHWAAGTELHFDVPGGGEFLLLSGSFESEGRQALPLSWIRMPIGATFAAVAGVDGAKVWIKTGHLRFVEAPSS